MSQGESGFRCLHCPAFLAPVTTPGGGRVGWVCHECDLLYPEHHLDIDPDGPT
jgi:hypothetical protein